LPKRYRRWDVIRCGSLAAAWGSARPDGGSHESVARYPLRRTGRSGPGT